MTHSWTDVWQESEELLKPTPKDIPQDFYNSEEIRKLGIKCGEGCLLHHSALTYARHNIILGDHVRIDAFCVLSPGAGYIYIGSYTHVSHYCCFMGAAGIYIHPFSAVGAYSSLLSVSDEFHGDSLIGPMVPLETRSVRSGKVTLEVKTALGQRVMCLPGSTVSEGSLILANSLVIGTTAKHRVLGGSPAKIIRPTLALKQIAEQFANAILEKFGK